MLSRISSALRPKVEKPTSSQQPSDYVLPDTLRRVLEGTDAGGLTGAEALFIGDPTDPLLNALVASGARVSCWHFPGSARCPHKGVECQPHDFERPWPAPDRVFDVLVSRGVLGRVVDPGALVRSFRELSRLLCLDHAPTADAKPSRSWIDHELEQLQFHTLPEDLTSGGASMLLAHRFDLPRANAPLLVHVHLPKNGGTSVNRTLQLSFGEGYVPLYLDDPAQQHTAETVGRALYDRPDARVISSHSFTSWPTMLGNRVPLYMCFLRHPVERHHSYYRYCRKDYATLSEAHRQAWLPPNFLDMDVNQFLEWHLGKNRQNGMTPNFQVQYFARMSAPRIAIRILEHFFFVGLTEQLERSLALLQKKLAAYSFDLKIAEETRHNVTAPHDTELPQWDPSLGSLAADEMLYEWSCERFEREAAQWGV